MALDSLWSRNIYRFHEVVERQQSYKFGLKSYLWFVRPP